jgi:uncharacterized protein
MKIASIAAVAALLAAAVALSGVGRPGAAQGSASVSGRTITVSGTGTVRTKPDTAQFSFGVETHGTTAQAASVANAQQMRRVIAALRRLGLAKDDLQTQDVSVYPRTTDTGAPDGFSASSSLSVTVHELSLAGKAVDAAVAAGANETSGPSFDRSSNAELQQEALRTAFAEARGKAAALARAAGADLGPAQRVVEGSAAPQPVPLAYRALDQASTPIESGTQTVQETVTVTFSLS